jgi:PAS domain S-box-containing protein
MGKTAQARTPDSQLFHDVFNASPIGILVKTLEGQSLFVNPAFCSFLGFSEEELLSKHCADFSPPEMHKRIGHSFSSIPTGVSHEVSLCLFRVLQEALHNAVKHSKLRQYDVRLGYSASEIHLTVSDRGTGFNPEAAMSVED